MPRCQSIKMLEPSLSYELGHHRKEKGPKGLTTTRPLNPATNNTGLNRYPKGDKTGLKTRPISGRRPKRGADPRGALIVRDNNATPLGVSYALRILITSDGSPWG